MMKPVPFPEHNAILKGDGKNIGDIAAFKTDDGIFLTCWKISFKDRIKLLFKGRIWSVQHTFHNPFQPMGLLTDKPEIYHTPKKPAND